MADLIDLLLGLDELSWSKRDLHLGWRLHLPGWGWATVILTAATLAVWSYSRLFGPKAIRFTLASVRTALILLVVVLIAGPNLVLTREHVEPDRLLMLVDRSASMTIRDTTVSNDGSDPGSVQWISRDDVMHRALTNEADLFGPNHLGRNRELLWLGFDSDVYPIQPPHLWTDAPTPDGHVTNLRSAIDQALGIVSGRPISGIVVFTDGRTPQSTGPSVTRLLKGLAVSIFPVPLGASTAPLDLRLGRVDIPDKAFINDTVPVTVWMQKYPQETPVDPRQVFLRLVDTDTGKTLDEQVASPNGLDKPVRLTGGSTSAGTVRWRVELHYMPNTKPKTDASLDEDNAPTANTSTQPAELITDNNNQELVVKILDRPLVVLYVEGYPRWEYRYLKNLLLREKSVESSIMLLSAGREFAQEGDRPIQRLPVTPEEIRPYDVIILGDVPAQSLSPEQFTLLRDHIAINGAGLLWIAGPYHTPRAYDATPLADMLPMRRPGSTRAPPPDRFPVRLTPTPLADALNVLRLTSSRGASPSTHPSWPELPPLWWVQDSRPLKPSAEVIAATNSMTSMEGIAETAPIPLITRLRYAKGQSLYVATDETWRWRYGVGDIYFERFWLQLIRMLGRHRVQQDPTGTRLSVSNNRVELGHPVVVELNLDDAVLVGRNLPRVSIAVSRATAPTGPEPTESKNRSAPGENSGDVLAGIVVERLELAPAQHPSNTLDGRDQALTHAASATRSFQTIWSPTTAGKLTLQVDEPALADLGLKASIDVIHPGDELRSPLPDHDRLARLAKETGGRIIPPDRLRTLVSVIPNRARRTPDDFREPLWDSPLSLILVVTLLTAEWICRKIIQLA